jgi:MFS family permease
LISVMGYASVVYLVNGIGAILSLFMVLRIPYSHDSSVKQPLTLRSILAGFRYIRNTQVLLAAMTLDMLGVLLGGATNLMPIFATKILAVGPNGYAWLLAAPALGAAGMAMIQARRRPFHRPGRALLSAVAGFGLATIVFGLSTNYWISLGALFVLGICDNISVVIRSTLIQMLTPDEMRGRVSSINGLFIVSSNDLGGFESGWAADLFTPVISVVSGGLGAIAVVAAVALLWPQLRNHGAPEPALSSGAAGSASNR